MCWRNIFSILVGNLTMKIPVRLLTCALISLLLFSCKKEKKDRPYYHFSFKLNGNWTTWSQGVADIKPDELDNSKTNLILNATSDDQKEIFDINIQTDGPDFNAIQYTTDNPAYITYISYVKQSATDIEFYAVETAAGRDESVYQVNITSITDTEVRGTFTGNYLYENHVDQTASIKEGEFVLPRIK